jgi:hypothetical protein
MEIQSERMVHEAQQNPIVQKECGVLFLTIRKIFSLFLKESLVQ